MIIPLTLLTDDIECEGSVGPGVKVPLSWLHRRQQAHAAEAFKALALCQGPVLCQQRLANAYVRKRRTSEVNPSIETITISERLWTLLSCIHVAMYIYFIVLLIQLLV